MKQTDSLDWVADLSSARFYQGMLGGKLNLSLEIHEKYGPMVGGTITGLTYGEVNYYIEKLMDIQSHHGEKRQREETLSLYEEVGRLRDLRLCEGEYERTGTRWEFPGSAGTDAPGGRG